jgi:septal ring factor EnvC (AmiA/AmiB activator)
MKKLLLIVLGFLIAYSGMAQVSGDKVQMEKERQAIQQEIKRLQSDYSKVSGQKKQNLAQLNLLQKKLALQNQYIGNINKEIRIISDDIYLSTLEVNRLNKQLDTLKSQYAKSVVYAYKNRSNYDFLNFIFSATTFNDALKRITYLKSYRAYRESQVNNIQATQKIIEDRKQQLLGKKNQKSSALQNQQQQYKVLDEQKKEKDEVVAKLKSQEKDLSKQLAAKKKRDTHLKGQITAIVRREIAAAQKAEKERLAALKKEEVASNKPTTATPAPKKTTAVKKEESFLTLNKGEAELAGKFESNRARLPWPVDNGYVSIHYGAYSIPGTSLKGDNPGITISTPSSGSSVKSVFEGEVSAVSNLGDGMMIVIRHGKYFTVYSNLSSASVSKGSTVRTGQVIGRTATADDGTGGQLDFLLMIESKNVNPEPWLSRR